MAEEEKHLIFLIHGLFGNPRHMKCMYDALDEQLKGHDDIVLHVAKNNAGMKTFDGVPLSAERLFRELMDKIRKISEEGGRVTKISFIGYSLGGLIARYMIGLLEEIDFFDTVEPVLFTTFATPHVGSKFHSTRLRARLLNFFGGSLLGISGQDLFGTSSTVEILADPAKCYYKGLKRFKHLVLFANAIHDRTVPYWTSFISNKNPFKVPEHVELKFYDHTKGEPEEDHTEEGATPIFIDMNNSTYAKESGEVLVLSKADKKRQNIVLTILPLIFPIILVVLSVTTLSSFFRYLLFRHMIGSGHKEILRNTLKGYRQKLETIKGKGDNAGTSDVHSDEPLLKSDPLKSHKNLNTGVASATNAFVEEFLDDVNADSNEDGNIEEDIVPESMPPKPMEGDGYSGLIDRTPYKLRISSDAERQVESLNKLHWKKFVVKLASLRSHAEIVNRRLEKGEGYEVQKFFAKYAKQLLVTENEP